MSLMICPDCGQQCSTAAAACPHCGHPFARPAAAPRVIVKEVPAESSFPKWIFIPIAILSAVVIFFLIVFLRDEDETANRSINVKVATTPLNATNARVNSTEVVTAPTPYSVGSTAPTPFSETPVNNTQIIQSNTVAVATPPADKGTLSVEAKILSRAGTEQAVTKETFYLLDRDLASILREADIDDPSGQGAVNAFGLSVVNPSKYREVNQKALAAINRHIVYRTLTDAEGKAEIKNIKPDSYYLFGITKTRNGFAIWDSPVSIQVGQNNVQLEPKAPTEIVTENQY